MDWISGSKLYIINFYHEQLEKFKKVGIGNKTEFGVTVTPELIKVTKNRLSALSVVYEAKLTPQAISLRKAKEKLLNGQQTNSNGSVTTSRVQNKRSTRHEGGKS